MFTKIPNGSEIIVQGLTCYIPPLGYGTHSDTAELAPVDIIKRSDIPAEQYWVVPKLDSDFEDKVALERARQDAELKETGLESNYVDYELEVIREREWHRRRYGLWFYNEGKPVYLTGINYFFLTYWMLDTGLPDYRLIDLEYFYFYQHCVENPKSIGGIEVRKRRDGKSLRAGCVAYEKASRSKNSLCGIQSMNDESAENFFEKNIVNPFKYLPSFFIPIWDTSAGSTPKGSLRFYKPSIKGKLAKTNLRGEELKSKIDFRNAKPKAYDGEKVKYLCLDESAKVETDVVARHSILKYCCLDHKLKKIGLMWVTSTVEMIGLKFRFKELWDNSNQYDLEEDGSTNTGLSRFFAPADRSGDYDIYGTPYTQKNRDEIILDRQKYKDDPDRMYGEMRKAPLSESEAFMFATDNCAFNLGKLNNRIWQLGDMQNLTQKGNFVWDKGERFGTVSFVKDRKGRFEILTGFQFDNAEDRNNVVKNHYGYAPLNKAKYIIGLDPYGTDDTEDYRNSNAAAMVYKKHNPLAQDHMFNKAFVCKYHGRPQTLMLMVEDMIRMCWYFGCEMLFENNKSEIQRHFIREGMMQFMTKIPGYKEYGIPSTEDNKYTLLTVTEEYIENNIDKVYFIDLLEDWKQFNIKKTTKYDLTMAAGWTLVAEVFKIILKDDGKLRKLSDYGFKKTKIA